MSAAAAGRGWLAGRRGALLQIILIAIAAIGLPSEGWLSPLLLAALAGALLWLSGDDWRAAGLGRPGRRAFWWVLAALAVGGLWQYAAVGLVAPLAGRLLNSPAPALPVPAGALGLLSSVIVDSFLEPLAKGLALRGLLLNRLEHVLGATVPGVALSFLLAAILFGLSHWRLGLAAVVVGALTGAVFNALYYWAGRNVWPSALAHAVFNAVALILLYLAYL